MVTLDCSVHKLRIICRISGLVFHFSLLLWPPIAVVLTIYYRGAIQVEISWWNSSSAIDFLHLFVIRFRSVPSNHQSNDVDLQLVNANHSPGTLHPAVFIAARWTSSTDENAASSWHPHDLQKRKCLNWMAVYGTDRRPRHCLVFSSIYTITISSP